MLHNVLLLNEFWGIRRFGHLFGGKKSIHCKRSCKSMWHLKINMTLPRLDEVEWVRYKTKLHKKSAREHIVAVTHVKAQNVIGKGKLGGQNLPYQDLLPSHSFKF